MEAARATRGRRRPGAGSGEGKYFFAERAPGEVPNSIHLPSIAVRSQFPLRIDWGERQGEVSKSIYLQATTIHVRAIAPDIREMPADIEESGIYIRGIAFDRPETGIYIAEIAIN